MIIEINEATSIGLLFQRTKDIAADVAMEMWGKSVLNFAEKQGFDAKSGLPLIEITMPCGSKVAYQTVEDLPKEDVACSCGDPNHWFVKYAIMETEEGKNNESGKFN